MADMNSLNKPSYNPALIVKDDEQDTTQETLQRSDYEKIANLSSEELNELETALNDQIAQLQEQLRIVYYIRSNRKYERR